MRGGRDLYWRGSLVYTNLELMKERDGFAGHRDAE